MPLQRGGPGTTGAPTASNGTEAQRRACGEMFSLVKWYFDLVTDDGTAVIAYAARLRLTGVRLTYAATLISPPAGSACERSVIGRVRPPRRTRDSIVWQC